MSAGEAFEGGDLAAVEQTAERMEFPHPFPSVPVNVDGPVQVQMVPTITGAPRTWVVGDAAEKLVGHDPRRAQVTLLSFDHSFYFGFTQAEADASTAARWPLNIPLTIKTQTELWVRSVTPGTPANVTLIPENWAS